MDILTHKKVLLVDDDEFIRISMEYFFRNKTGLFLAVETAELGMETIQKGDPMDIIIADYQLPGMDGVSFLQWVKERLPLVLTVMITAHSSPKLLAEIGNSGIHHLILKPFIAGTMLSALNRLLESSSSH